MVLFCYGAECFHSNFQLLLAHIPSVVGVFVNMLSFIKFMTYWHSVLVAKVTSLVNV